MFTTHVLVLKISSQMFKSVKQTFDNLGRGKSISNPLKISYGDDASKAVLMGSNFNNSVAVSLPKSYL